MCVLQVAPACNIFARASPENKLRIVRALQRAAPKKASEAVAKAALQSGKSLSAVSKDLVSKSQDLGNGKDLTKVSQANSRTSSPDVMVDIALNTTSYCSDMSQPEEKLRYGIG